MVPPDPDDEHWRQVPRDGRQRVRRHVCRLLVQTESGENFEVKQTLFERHVRAVWPDLAKLCQSGNILNVLGNF